MNSFGKLTACPLLRRPFTIASALILAANAAQAADYPTTVLGDNPVAYYRLEELPGSGMAADSTTNHLDAAIDYDTAGTVPELGLPGIDSNSIAFTGESSADYGSIDIPYNVLLAPVTSDGQHGAPFSIECWVQAYSANNNGAYLAILGMFGPYSSGVYGNASGWLLAQTPGPGSEWAFNMKNAGFLTPTAVVPLQWTHLVGTFDGTNQYFYINGVLAGSQPGVGTGYYADDGSDGIIGSVPNAGLVPDGPYSEWNGGVDEVAFYTNALSLTQVANHYQVGTNSFRIVPTAPGILAQPSDETNFAGTSVEFSVIANGTAPIYYQWVRQGSGPIAGATNSAYTFVSQFPADDQASFYVIITNSVGATNSQTVTLSVQTNLNIIGPPFSITRNVGSHAAFRVAVGGAVPFGYQWSVSSNSGSTFTALPGQTGDTLWLTNVQLSANGNQYAVVVTNPFTSYSNSATLTVQPRTETVPLTGYGAIVAADQPVAYWRLDESDGATVAVDAVGTFDGTYDDSLGTIVWGIPTGIPNDSDPAVDLQDPQTAATGQGGIVTIPYALELNPYGPWSVEAWVRPDSVDGQFRTPLASMYNPDSGNAVSGWNIYEYGSVPAYWTMVLYNGGAGGSFGSDLNDPIPTPGTWWYLVITDDGVNIQLYVNAKPGSANTSQTVAGTGYLPNGINGDPGLAGGNEVIGQRTDDAFYGANAGMDDVAIYNYALSPAQIEQHFENRGGLTITRMGDNLVLTWATGTLLGSPTVAGPYTPVSGATSPYTVPITNTQFFYQVVMN